MSFCSYLIFFLLCNMCFWFFFFFLFVFFTCFFIIFLLTKNHKIMFVLIGIFVYGVFLSVCVVLRRLFKLKNPKYGFFDDFLFFSGVPITFAYIWFLILDPDNFIKDVSELFTTPLMFILLTWTLFSSIIFLIRQKTNGNPHE